MLEELWRRLNARGSFEKFWQHVQDLEKGNYKAANVRYGPTEEKIDWDEVVISSIRCGIEDFDPPKKD